MKKIKSTQILFVQVALLAACSLFPKGLFAQQCALDGVVTVLADQFTPVPIPSSGLAESQITVAGAGNIIVDLNVITNITHTFPGDLDMVLISPAGTIVTLSTDNGSSFDNVYDGTLWDDSANPGGQVPYTSNNGLVTD